MVKTRVKTAIEYVMNYSSPIGRIFRTDYGKDPYDSDTKLEDLPEGYLAPSGWWLDGIWPMGEYRFTESITCARTPPPHTVYTECHQERVELFDAHSTWMYALGRPGWRDGELVDLGAEAGYNGIFYISAMSNWQHGTIHAPSAKQVRQAQEQALLSLWAGRPRQHMNVALALIELRDVKKTITQFSEFASWGIKALKGQIQLPAHIASAIGLAKGAQISCRKMAEGYLWYTFGVRPTIDDVTCFCKEVGNGKLSIKGSKRKPLLVGRTYANGFYASDGFDWKSYNVNFTDKPIERSGHYKWLNYMGNPVWHVEPKVTHRSSSGFTVREVYGKVFAKVREQGKWTWKYFPSSFSWSCPLFRTAWELVPFSFVVDWFLDVGKSIKRLDDLSWVATTRFAFDEPWVSMVSVDTHYTYQSNSYASSSIKNLTHHGYGQSMVCECDLEQHGRTVQRIVPERKTITYDRHPASAYGLTYASLWRDLVPEWRGKLKAYQISSGMALLESVFHLI